MAGAGKTAAVAGLTLALGFIAGACLVWAGFVYRFFPLPRFRPVNPPAVRSERAVVPVPVNVPGPYLMTDSPTNLPEVADRADLQPTPGCEWVVLPRPFRRDCRWHWHDFGRILVGYPSVDPETGALRYLLAQLSVQGEPVLDLRPVFFDAEGKRYLARGEEQKSSLGWRGGFVMRDFSLDVARQLPPAKVAYVGIECIPTDEEKQRVEAAQREAKDKGIAILPPARFGEPYTFDLPTTDGKRVRSEDLRGKVVLVAVIGPASHGPLGLSMVEKALESVPTQDALDVVSVSFDATVKEAQLDFARSDVEGPRVFVPNDPAIRKLWAEGSQIHHLPMLLLIDREGVLRFQCTPFELQDRVDILFGRAKRAPAPKVNRVIFPAGKEDAIAYSNQSRLHDRMPALMGRAHPVRETWKWLPREGRLRSRSSR